MQSAGGQRRLGPAAIQEAVCRPRILQCGQPRRSRPARPEGQDWYWSTFPAPEARPPEMRQAAPERRGQSGSESTVESERTPRSFFQTWLQSITRFNGINGGKWEEDHPSIVINGSVCWRLPDTWRRKSVCLRASIFPGSSWKLNVPVNVIGKSSANGIAVHENNGTGPAVSHASRASESWASEESRRTLRPGRCKAVGGVLSSSYELWVNL